MILSGIVRRLPFTSSAWASPILVSALLVLGLAPLASAQNKPSKTSTSIGVSQAQPADPSDLTNLKPLSQNGSILSIQGGQRLMEEASAAVTAQKYDVAIQKLQEARQVFNQLSNFYQDLAASFSGIDNAIASSQRRRALETAQMRDQATYQLALVHRAQNQPELSVPLLIQIIRSQQPTRDLGKKAYQQLLELGFVDSPFPTAGQNSQPSTSATSAK